MALLRKARPASSFVYPADDPTVTDDRDAGFVVGDQWFRQDTGDAWWLGDDAPGAADWVAMAGGGGGQAADDDLDELSALSGTGFAVRTATTPTWATRTLVAGAGVTITNPAGIAGDPTIAATGAVYARKVKTADTSRNTTTTMAADPDLTFSLPAGLYSFRGDAYAIGDASADWKVSLTTSDAADLLGWYWNTSNVFVLLTRTFTGLNYSLSVGTTWPGDGRVLNFGGTVEIVGGTHDLYLTWAQQTSTGANVTVKKGSWMEVIAIV